MKSPFQFIVKPLKGKRYDNTKEIGGIDFIISTSQEDHKFSNRYAEVVSTPIDYSGPIQTGDILLVHHNVFKFYNDMYGRRKSGKSYFKDNLFFVDPEQFYLFKTDKGWKSHGKYCFVKPLPAKKAFIDKGGKYERLQGTVKYINDELIDLGVSVGDNVIFTPHSEYEFTVEDELLYRMFTNNITTIIDE